MSRLFVPLFLLTSLTTSAAQTAPTAPTAVPATTTSNSLGGVQFGAGFSMTKDTGSRDRVEEAVIDETGIVRVTKRGNSIARIMLEMHYFFELRKDRIGLGPFMAIQPGSNEVINSMGAGVMLGLRKAGSTQSFNIGLGMSADPNAKILGKGLVEGLPAPLTAEGNPAQIRYEQDDQFGWLLLFSFGW